MRRPDRLIGLRGKLAIHLPISEAGYAARGAPLGPGKVQKCSPATLKRDRAPLQVTALKEGRPVFANVRLAHSQRKVHPAEERSRRTAAIDAPDPGRGVYCERRSGARRGRVHHSIECADGAVPGDPASRRQNCRAPPGSTPVKPLDDDSEARSPIRSCARPYVCRRRSRSSRARCRSGACGRRLPASTRPSG